MPMLRAGRAEVLPLAEKQIQQALDLRRALFGEGIYWVAQSLNNLAILRGLQGREGRGDGAV